MMSMDEPEKYLKDIETIRSLMVAYDERQVVEHWVFHVYAAFAVVGTGISWVLFRRTGLSATAMILEVWLPLFVIAASSETVGFLRQLRKSGVVVLSRRLRKFLTASGGIMVVLTFLVLRIAPTDLTPGIVLMFAAVPLFIYAQASFGQLFVEAFFLLALGLVSEAAGWHGPNLAAVSGLVVGLVYSAAGFHSKRCEAAD